MARQCRLLPRIGLARFELANAYLNVNRYTDGEQVALKLLATQHRRRAVRR